MAVASAIANSRDRLASEASAEEERALFREQQARLQEAQRVARIVQEEAAVSESEDNEPESASLNRLERVSIFSYSASLIVACFKDLLDFTIVMALPVIAPVISLCANALIVLLLFFPKHRYRIASNARLIIIDAFILLGLIPLEGLAFPFNLLPFTVAAVGMIYVVDKKFVAARNSKHFDKRRMKENLSRVIRQASSDRGNTDKSRVSEQMRSTWDMPERETRFEA
ncbi:MAG: hypothetical protein IPK84_03015 [Candidatus Moraniibacteriota bacterium]|nr:MAG: hypothetical protein IPK84_03015 [Candidatus Moranbacteria bacterium]